MIKVLYVEDEANLAKIVMEMLVNRKYDVRLVQRGDLAFHEFKSYNPDICILDVMLPYVDGYEIGKQIRSLNPKVPIIYVTAKGQTEDALKGFSVGGNDYIRKPFSVEELIVRINNLLHLTHSAPLVESPSEGSGPHAIGQYVFFPGRQELILGEKIKRLSHRETELLAALVNQKQETVLRKQILDKIWGNDSFFNSRNLDVYITKLRDYLKEDEKIQIITLKGVGYRLVD